MCQLGWGHTELCVKLYRVSMPNVYFFVDRTCFFLLSLSSPIHHSTLLTQSAELQLAQSLYCNILRHPHHQTLLQDPSPRSPQEYCGRLYYLTGFPHTLFPSAKPFKSARISSLPGMVNKLRKSQPKAQEEGSKANMLKRFGGKFKQVFAKKKLVCMFS